MSIITALKNLRGFCLLLVVLFLLVLLFWGLRLAGLVLILPDLIFEEVEDVLAGLGFVLIYFYTG